jgi:hypothetical protein
MKTKNKTKMKRTEFIKTWIELNSAKMVKDILSCENPIDVIVVLTTALTADIIYNTTHLKDEDLWIKQAKLIVVNNLYEEANKVKRIPLSPTFKAMGLL